MRQAWAVDDAARTAQPRPAGALARPDLLLRLRPHGGALPVHGHHRLVAHYPGVVSWWQRADLTGSHVDLCTVSHLDVDAPGDVVLLVGCHAQVCAGDRLHVLGPLPPRLQGKASDLSVAGEIHQLQTPVVALADLIRLVKRNLLERLVHQCTSELAAAPPITPPPPRSVNGAATPSSAVVLKDQAKQAGQHA